MCSGSLDPCCSPVCSLNQCHKLVSLCRLSPPHAAIIAADRRQQIALLRLEADNRALSARLADAEERVAHGNRVWEARLASAQRDWELQREQQLAELKQEAHQAVWEETERLLRIERRADERAEEQFKRRRLQAVLGAFWAGRDRAERRCGGPPLRPSP